MLHPLSPIERVHSTPCSIDVLIVREKAKMHIVHSFCEFIKLTRLIMKIFSVTCFIEAFTGIRFFVYFN